MNYKGTSVAFRVNLNQKQTLQDLFKQYTDAPESYGFIKTIIPIKLLEYGDQSPIFVSRSQARRLLTRIERFKIVQLDFSGIETIVQGFADEVFRVFKSNHPDVELSPINCSEAVHQMIRHILEYRQSSNSQPQRASASSSCKSTINTASATASSNASSVAVLAKRPCSNPAAV